MLDSFGIDIEAEVRSLVVLVLSNSESVIESIATIHHSVNVNI
jgi:hypothetical protein